MATSSKVGSNKPKAELGSPLSVSLETAVVMLKVSIVLVGWLAVFLMTFLGYLTLPAVVLFGFLVVYTTIDWIGRMSRKARSQK